MNGQSENGTERSGFRTMTGSNPSFSMTRLAERQQITGINYRTAIRQFKHTPGSENERNAIGSIGKTRVDLNSNYSSQILFKS